MAAKTSTKSKSRGSRSETTSKSPAKKVGSKTTAKRASASGKSKSTPSKGNSKPLAKAARKAGSKPADLQAQLRLLTEKIASLEKNIQGADTASQSPSTPTEISPPAPAIRRQKTIPVYEVKEVHPIDLEIRGTHPLVGDEDGLQISLLDRARIQWLRGDWDGLSKIDLEQIQSHPDIAELALFGAIGRIQAGDLSEASKYLSFAKKRGCSSKLIQAILLSGIHSAMYSANLLKGSENKALKHKSELKSLGVPDSLANNSQQLNSEQPRSSSDLNHASRSLLVATYQNLAHSKVD